jgi:hypothetical protein
MKAKTTQVVREYRITRQCIKCAIAPCCSSLLSLTATEKTTSFVIRWQFLTHSFQNSTMQQSVQWLGYRVDVCSSIPGRRRAFSLRRCAHNGSEARGIFPRVQSDRGVKLNTHFHPVPRIRMRGAVPLLPHVSWNSAQHRDNSTFTSHSFPCRWIIARRRHARNRLQLRLGMCALCIGIITSERPSYR